MRRFLNNRISNYNNVGDKVDDFCKDCENRWLPFSRVWWDSTEKNIADIKRKDNGIFVIKKILSLINSISESIKDIYDKINVIETPTLSEKLIELENDYLEVDVTADGKQEDLNIAIYENYINLKNTKVDKPLIESTSDSLKIVALDNQGESVFIKSNELGKVKSVNNKIGDVILKTSDLENDSDYTTNLKLNQEIGERISGDNLKLDKPTTSGTTTTHPNIVGVDDLGNSAKLKATDFGKVKSVNGKEGDVILKTSDLENDSDYTTNATLTAHTSNKANPHNVTKSQIGLGNVDNTSDLNKPISTATQNTLDKKIDKPTINNTNEYVLLADGSTAPKSDFGKVDTVMGVQAGANKNVDISGVAMNWTNASQRWSALPNKSGGDTYNRVMVLDADGKAGTKDASDLGKNFANTDLVVTTNRKHTGTGSVEFGFPFTCSNASVRYSGLVDKSADATYNRLLGMDSQGNLNEVGIYALTNEMSKSTNAQKDAWRVASLKSNEKFSVGQPRIDTLLPPIVSKEVSYKQYVTITGINLFINVHTQTSKVYLVKVKDGNGVDIQPNSEGYYPTEILIDNVSVNYTIPTQLSFGLDFSLLDLGSYKIRVINDSVGSLLGGLLKIVPSIPSTTIINPKYEYYDPTFNTLQETINAQGTQKTLTANNTHYIKSPISFLKSEIGRLQSMIFDVGVLWSVQSGSGNYKVTVGLLSNTGLQIPLVTMDEGYKYVAKSYQLVVQIQNAIASVARFDTINFNKSIILTDVATSYTIYFKMYTEGPGASFTYNLNLTSYYKQE